MHHVIVKKSKFIKEQEASGLLNSSGIKTPLNKIPLLVSVRFCVQQVNTRSKMNEIVNKFLLAGEKCMLEMHLRQPGFTYSICGPVTKKKERIKKSYIYQNKLDKACLQHDMVYGDFNDLNTRTFANQVLHDKAFDIANDLKYAGYWCGIASMVILVVVLKMKIFLIKK